MTYFSMFSGIGGFEYGIEQAYNNTQFATEKSGQTEPKIQFWRKRTFKQGRSNELSDRYRKLPSNRTPKCIGYSEIDKYAAAIYRFHYPEHTNYGDATAIDTSELPDFDLLIGGFPCQSFSIAGKRKGFNDTQGTLFFDIARVLRDKLPGNLLLENVKGLLSHDDGKTFTTILGVLTDIGYELQWQVLNSKDYGVPQNRERVFIIGHIGGERKPEVFPIGEADQTYNGSAERNSKEAPARHDIQSRERQAEFTGRNTWKYPTSDEDISTCLDANYGKGWPDHGQRTMIDHRNKRNHRDCPTLLGNDHNVIPMVAQALQTDGQLRQGTSWDTDNPQSSRNIRRLTPIECERLQGFPDNWTKWGLFDNDIKEISDTQRYKCLGNAVTTNVITAIMERIMYCTHNI